MLAARSYFFEFNAVCENLASLRVSAAQVLSLVARW